LNSADQIKAIVRHDLVPCRHEVADELLLRIAACVDLGKGAKLIVVDPRRIPLTRHATIWLRPKPGTDVAWINGFLHVILAEGLCVGGL
jgi:anaerobic selenocysteine-containing dehydrogenase